MKMIKFMLLLVLGLIVLVGCEDGASIKIINQTNYNVYANVEGDSITVAGNSSYKVNVDTDEKVFLFDDGVTKKTLKIEGETFRMWDYYDERPYTETDIKLTPGKTYNVYCNANSASVKVINNSTKKIKYLKYQTHTQFSSGELFFTTYDPPLELGQFGYEHLAPQTEENRFFYSFQVETEDGTVYSFGNEFQGTELFMGEQYLIEIQEEMK